ncbi:hypothetical protein [Limosilactobacillus fermentum]
MEQLPYRPNAIAPPLLPERPTSPGLVFPNRQRPFFHTCLYENGYQDLMGNSQNNPQKEEQYLQLLLNPPD